MSHRGPFGLVRLLFFLLLIGVLIAIGNGLYQSGMAQGYWIGRASAATTSGTAPAQPVPGAPFGYYPGYYPGYSPFGGGLHFPFIGLLFCGGFLFLLFIVIGGAYRRHAWKHGMAGSGQAENGETGERGPWGRGPWGPGPWEHGPWAHGHGSWSRPEETPQANQPPATPPQPPANQPNQPETPEQKPM